MARRRWLSTKISTDGPVNRLAMQHGDFAALFFTWMIPAAGDDGAIWGDPEEILVQVMPHRRDVPASQVIAVLELLASPEFDLVTWDAARRVVRFKPESFRRHQSYITDARWEKATAGVWADAEEQRGSAPIRGEVAAEGRATPHNSADQRTTAQNAADQRTTPLSFSSSFPSSFPSSSSLSSGSGSELDPELVAEGEGETPPPPARARATSRPVPLPSLDDLCGCEVVAEWMTMHGVAAELVREDLGRYRDGVIAKHEGRSVPPRLLAAWENDARKWLNNVDYGPAARRGATKRRAPPDVLTEAVSRDEAKLARSLTTIAEFRGRR